MAVVVDRWGEPWESPEPESYRRGIGFKPKLQPNAESDVVNGVTPTGGTNDRREFEHEPPRMKR